MPYMTPRPMQPGAMMPTAPGAPNQRNAIAQALMNVASPPPQMGGVPGGMMPPGQGMPPPVTGMPPPSPPPPQAGGVPGGMTPPGQMLGGTAGPMPQLPPVGGMPGQMPTTAQPPLLRR